MKPKISKAKVVITMSIFGIWFLLVVTKAFQIQVLQRDELIERSRSQVLREIKVYPKRGVIYDREKRPLALNIETFSIFAIPKQIEDVDRTINEVEKILPGVNSSYLKKRLKSRKRFTWIDRKIELDKEQVKRLKELKGVFLESVPKRLYPNHEILSQTLGFVGIDNTGLSGIEYFFDEKLRGKPKVVKYLKDNKGRPVKFESQDLGINSQPVVLSIDLQIQAMAEKFIKEGVVEHQAVKGGIGVIDVQSGEILAMANYPTFDPNHLKGSKQDQRKLSFISDPFEPGSTFKTFTIVSALENNISRTDTNYYCEKGKLKVQGHIINEAESEKGYEWLSVEEILRYSSNIGTTKIAFDLTYPRLKKTLEKFGIGKKSGVELPGESRGIFDDTENVQPIRLSNVSFGQGVATTGIQMLAAYAAIANDGVWVDPTVIKRKSPPEGRRIISESVAKAVQKVLHEAVTDGTGSNAIIPYFQIAGKTSTAQKVDESGQYGDYIPGFIGFPLNVDRRFVIYVYVDGPKGKYYGNLVAAPIFRKLAEFILYRKRKLLPVKKSEESQIASSDIVRIQHSGPKRMIGKDKVPNFIGLDKKSAGDLARKSGVEITHQGIGVVEKQSPSAGEGIGDGIVRLKYSPPTYE